MWGAEAVVLKVCQCLDAQAHELRPDGWGSPDGLLSGLHKSWLTSAT